MISDFRIFPINAFETVEFCCIAVLTPILRLLYRENFTLMFSFYCSLVKEGWAPKIA